MNVHTVVMYGCEVLVAICGLVGLALCLVWIFTLFGILLPITVNLVLALTMIGCFWVVWQLAPAVDAFNNERFGHEPAMRGAK